MYFHACIFVQDWTSTQLLHVYQGQLVTGTTVDATRDAAFIDLRNQQSFSETFYLVVLERSADHHSYLHMWEIIVSSLQQDGKECDLYM